KGLTSPNMALISVDFPAPLGPTTPMTAPIGTPKLTSYRTGSARYATARPVVLHARDVVEVMVVVLLAPQRWLQHCAGILPGGCLRRVRRPASRHRVRPQKYQRPSHGAGQLLADS